MFPLLVLANVVLCGIVAHWLVSNIDSDEVEHVHVAWALNQGIMPYRDIHQNHLPTLWIVVAPALRRLPETAQTVLALRGMSILAIFGIYFIGLSVLREIIGPLNRYHALSLSLLLLSIVPITELYRFRPDPWMAFFSALAILAAVRLKRSPQRYAFWCGLSLGIAAAFTTKMAPLCLLIPTLCLWECFRLRSVRPLLPIVPNAVGFIVGILPVAGWIAFHGLFKDFQQSGLSGNCRQLNLGCGVVVHSVLATCHMAVLPILGGLLLLQDKRGDLLSSAWSPLRALLAALALTWLIIILTPTHNVYNLQAFAMPSAVAGAYFLPKVGEMLKRVTETRTRSWLLGFTLVCAVLASVLERPFSECLRESSPNTIPRADLQRLIELCGSRDATCVALAPWHPVFCRDATDLYLGWDYMHLAVPWTSDVEREKLITMWRRAVAEIEEKPPTLVFSDKSNFPWSLACRQKIISQDRYDRLLQFLQTHYWELPIDASGKPTVFVRKEPAKQP